MPPALRRRACARRRVIIWAREHSVPVRTLMQTSVQQCEHLMTEPIESTWQVDSR